MGKANSKQALAEAIRLEDLFKIRELINTEPNLKESYIADENIPPICFGATFGRIKSIETLLEVFIIKYSLVVI